MNRRIALIAAVYLVAASIPSLSHAQAAPAQAAPAAKWVPPVKGEASVEFVQGTPSRIKGEVLTKMKVRNTSKGSIALLSVEEIWYNSKREIASSGIFRVKSLSRRGNRRVYDQLAGEAGPAAEHADVQARQRDDQADQGQEAALSGVQSRHGLLQAAARA